MLISDYDLQKLIARQKLLSSEKLNEVVASKREDQSLMDTLADRELIPREKLYSEIAKELKLPFTRLLKSDINEDFLRILPEKVAHSQEAVVFKRDKDGIGLALCDPSNAELSVMISKKTGQAVKIYLTTPEEIKKILPYYRESLQKTLDAILKDKTIGFEAPIAKIVDLLINYAYRDRASDIHIEPEENKSLVRFRIDGMLHDALSLPKDLHQRVITRIKVLSKIQTDEHQKPQDGKIRYSLEDDLLDIRVSIIPVADGEKVALRLLTSKAREYDLSSLGLSDADLKKIQNSLGKPYGMILSTGPTGSGKTTSIYALLKILNDRDRNVTTIEDPVEYRIKGVNQIQVNNKANLTFANGLASILRQDPDIIFVGEIRDNQTAAIAVNAALTGHLVLSTLHTSDAVGALPRLVDMGVEELLLSSTANIIIAQRLLRKICDQCKTPVLISSEDLAKNISKNLIKKIFGTANKVKLHKGTGCATCHETGYLGRLGIFEVLPVTKKLRQLLNKGTDADQILDLALKEGMTTMFEDGLVKVRMGLTTTEEVLRVTKSEQI
ncbi:type II/IV secretion system protein [Candidatus Curtissbacteria bacterium]|nr:type II/IV secretion system protein [Candidatus Curtissbacteria bacterium]